MKILFISHDASLSGAPKMLLELIRWIKTNKQTYVVDLLILQKGVLDEDFYTTVDNLYHLPQKSLKNKGILQILNSKIKSKLGGIIISEQQKLIKRLIENDYNVVYSNTVISVSYGAQIAKTTRNCKHLAHIHELQLKILYSTPNFGKYINDVDHYLCPADIVKKNLEKKWSIPKNKIEVVPECSYIHKKYSHETSRNSQEFIVGASGLSYWRKGNDVFLQVARYLRKHYSATNIKFVWVGNEHLDKKIIENDIDKMGLKRDVSFVGQSLNPDNYYNSFDVFLLTSREDPFPLVCIEMGQLGKPIICFEGASGTADVLIKGGGYVVPYLDIEAMAEKIMAYYNDKDLLIKDSNRAKELFSNFTPEKICPQYFDVIEAVLQK